jgi:hypothetical protein
VGYVGKDEEKILDGWGWPRRQIEGEREREWKEREVKVVQREKPRGRLRGL